MTLNGMRYINTLNYRFYLRFLLSLYELKLKKSAGFNPSDFLRNNMNLFQCAF